MDYLRIETVPPVSVSVFEGNTGDPKTLMPQVEKMRDAFGIEQFVLVGDRGMLTQKQVDALHDIDGVDWIGALRPEAIKKLATNGAIQTGLIDERIYSFRSLLGHLGAIVRATCRCPDETDTSATFTMITKCNPTQQKAFDLLQTIRV